MFISWSLNRLASLRFDPSLVELKHLGQLSTNEPSKVPSFSKLFVWHSSGENVRMKKSNYPHTKLICFILTFCPNECQMKSFEKMSMLLSAIISFDCNAFQYSIHSTVKSPISSDVTCFYKNRVFVRQWLNSYLNLYQKKVFINVQVSQLWNEDKKNDLKSLFWCFTI